MSRILQAIWNWFIPDALRADPETLRQANRVLAFCCAMTIWVPIYACVYAALGAPTCALIIGIAGVLLAIIAVLQRMSRSPFVAGNAFVMLAFFVYSGLAAYTGGHSSPPELWYVSMPVMAVLLVGVRGGVFWTLIAVLGATAFYVAHLADFAFPQELGQKELAFVHFTALVGLLGCMLLLTLVFKTVEAAAQRSLETALHGAEAADRAKSEFLANMSHEIRTPMTAILGYADLLSHEASEAKKPLEPAAVLSHLHTIQRNGAHLLQVINDILDLSKIEAGKLEAERIPCSPRQVVAEVMALLRGRAEVKRLDFYEEYVGPVPETILSDPTRLRQILLNLVGNALKFTETGGVRLVTRFPAAPGDQRLQFEVIDTGIGMTPEQMSKSFVPFSQADSSTTRRFGGTGLGLAISKRLVEMLGGEISIESRLGRGSVLKVRLPVERAGEERLAAPPAVKPAHGAARRLNCRILLAEDGPDNQRLLAHVLGRAGAQVSIAENGQIALDMALRERAKGTPFDVILMDMQMPVLGGYEATRRLREQGYERPIVALTAHAMAADRQHCLAAGCNDYATKPLDHAALFAVIDRQLRDRRAGEAPQNGRAR